MKAKKHDQKKFIVFVGNLPYDTEKKDLEDIFKGINATIRMATDKQTGKPKGFAFLEFSKSDDMQKALNYHHHSFKGRKINVELTAGGGGPKSEVRRKRIADKNSKLNEERQKNFIQ